MGKSIEQYSPLTFQTVLESTPNAIVLINDGGEITYANKQAEILFDYTKVELIGETIERLIPERYHKDHPGFRHAFFSSPSVRAMGTGRDLFALRKDGSEVPVEIGLNPVDTESGTLVLASIIDITERKKSEERFRLVVNSAPNSMVLVDRTGKITLVNTQTEHLFGYQKEELIGQKLEILIPDRFKTHHHEYRDQFFGEPVARSMGTGRDLFALRKDGSEIQVEIGLNPIETPDGQVVLASIIDITERKKHEAIINNQIKELEIKNRELEQFTYIASHDLQEPLRTLTNIIQLLENEHQDDQLNETTKQYFGYLSASSARMSSLVKGLLDYSRIGRAKEMETVDCRAILNDVIDDLKSSIEEANAELSIGELPKIKGNPTELRLLFQNLINNAIKFRHENINPKVTINSEKEGYFWKFSVQDNGIGIPEKYKKKIFIIFQRLHSNDAYKGTGIGLSHCQKIVESHGGRIWVESIPEEGSVFYFTMPGGSLIK